ncbi:MAG: HDIG domain-containing protein [Sphaerochaeta sp.]|nr:HDIG domain-containing protein [Sphaerochaeta sp.]
MKDQRLRLGEKRKPNKLERQISIALIILIVVLAMLVPLFSSKSADSLLQDRGRMHQVGELAEDDVYATENFSYIDEKRTQALIQEKQRAVAPLFTFSLRSTMLSRQRIDLFIDLMDNGEDGAESFLAQTQLTDTGNVIERLRSFTESDRWFFLQALEETAEVILKQGLFSASDLAVIEAEGYDSYVLQNTVSMQDAKLLEPQLVSTVFTKENLATVLISWLDGYRKVQQAFQPYLLVDALSWLLEENVVYEEVQTLTERQKAADSVQSIVVLVERGEKIITKDTVITEQQLALLEAMVNQAFQYTILEMIGRAVFILLATSVSVYVFIQFLYAEKRLYLYLNLMLASVALSMLAMYAVSHLLHTQSILFLDSFLPILFAPMFTAHITSKKRLGLVAAFLLSCYASLMPQASAMTFFFSLTAGGICLYFFRYTFKRLEDLFNWFYACVICSFAALALNLLVGLPLQSVLPLIGGMLLNVTISLVLVEALVPLCERGFNIPTAYRLSELAFTDSPVLDRLGTVAQGTYNHSRYVSDLAYQAAKAIGVNAMLAKVGGIYHDIGKSDHPEYFIENQGTENKHDDIKPSLSAAIIKSHVKLGLEKGREAGLPQEVLDIIAQHHGNDIIQFFYNEAKEQALSAGAEVKADDYSYTGSPPTFPESAIVMLADCVEAASRTIKKPNHSKYQKLVHAIIMGKFERDQLKDSQLSLTDLDQIEDAFVQTLIGRDHHRIDYPDEPDQKSRGE